MRTRSLLQGGAVLALTATLVMGGVQTAAAIQVDSPGPLTKVVTNPDLSCQTLRAGDNVDAFYGSDACGTFVYVDGTNYGPDVDAGADHHRVRAGVAERDHRRRERGQPVHGHHSGQLDRRPVHHLAGRPVHRRPGAVDHVDHPHEHRCEQVVRHLPRRRLLPGELGRRLRPHRRVEPGVHLGGGPRAATAGDHARQHLHRGAYDQVWDAIAGGGDVAEHVRVQRPSSTTEWQSAGTTRSPTAPR